MRTCWPTLKCVCERLTATPGRPAGDHYKRAQYKFRFTESPAALQLPSPPAPQLRYNQDARGLHHDSCRVRTSSYGETQAGAPYQPSSRIASFPTGADSSRQRRDRSREREHRHRAGNQTTVFGSHQWTVSFLEFSNDVRYRASGERGTQVMGPHSHVAKLFGYVKPPIGDRPSHPIQHFGLVSARPLRTLPGLDGPLLFAEDLGREPAEPSVLISLLHLV